MSLPAILLVGFGLVIPVLALLGESLTIGGRFGLHGYTAFFSDPTHLRIFWRTVRIASIVTAASLIMGFPAAWAISRIPKHRRAMLMALLLLPLLISPVARTYAWIVILSPIGPVNSLLLEIGLIAEPLRILYTETAVFLGLLQLLLPLMILPLVSALENLPPDLADAARTLGANPVSILLRIVAPLTARGIAIGATLVFTGSCAAFITPQVLGGGHLLMMETLLYQQVALVSDLGTASVIAGILIALCLAVNALLSRVRG